MSRMDRQYRIVLWLAAAFALTLAVLPQPTNIPGASVTFQHMLAFCTLTILARLSFRTVPSIVIALGLVLFGASIKVIQMLPFLHRNAEWSDLAADSLAILSTLGAIGLIRRVVARASDQTGW